MDEKWDNVLYWMSFPGLVLGLLLCAFGSPITYEIYDHFGIVDPICDSSINCIKDAFFEISFYLLVIVGVMLIAICGAQLLFGCPMRFEDSEKLQVSKWRKKKVRR